MREYSNTITLTKNIRGVYSLDTILGCSNVTNKNKNGCYDDCYAARYARKYGYDFSKPKLRFFKDEKHAASIVRKINKLDVDFIRVGTSGDPSINWAHTIGILEQLEGIKKTIVIITKHWNELKPDELRRLSYLNVCVNTSISVLDGDFLEYRIGQYLKLEKWCTNSVLRIVTFNFNTENRKGFYYNSLQNDLLSEYKVLETAFRCSPKNKYVESGIIKRDNSIKFLGKKCGFSKRSDSIHIGLCIDCLDKCGTTH